MTMFAIPVQLGCEKKAAEEINVSAGGELAFAPCAEIRVSKGSGFGYEPQPMLPGFVLLDVADGAAARKACRRARGLAEVAEESERAIELTARERALISAFVGSGEAAFSEGVMRNGRLSVESGALVDRERLIGHVSHRRKRAFVPATVGGNPVELQFGLRIKRQGGDA